MTHRIFLLPLLIASLLFAGCYSHTHYRAKAETNDARSEAQICLADCRDSTDDDDSYYACLQECPGLVHETGRCDPSVQVCEEEKTLRPGKTFGAVVATGATLLLVAVVTAVAAAPAPDFECEGVAHC